MIVNVTIKVLIFTLKIQLNENNMPQYQWCMCGTKEKSNGGTHDEDWNITEYVWDYTTIPIMWLYKYTGSFSYLYILPVILPLHFGKAVHKISWKRSHSLHNHRIDRLSVLKDFLCLHMAIIRQSWCKLQQYVLWFIKTESQGMQHPVL